MTEPNIWEQVRFHARQLGDIETLAPTAVERLAQLFTNRYVDDPLSRWWWDSLQAHIDPIVFDYGDLDSWDIIPTRVPERDSFVLLVTDEEAKPRGAVRGSIQMLRALVAELPYFEYLITDDDASFGIFDTHHNSVVEVESSS